MIIRIISGAIYAIGALCLFFFANELGVWAIMGILSIISVYEFNGAVGFKSKNKPLAILSFIFSLAIMLAIYYNKSLNTSSLSGTIIIYMVISFIYMVLNHAKTSFSDVCTSIMGTCYITVFFMTIFLLRSMPQGKLFIWIPFIIAWLTDTFAYFSGRFFGKHKLIPSVSPKKTVEGSIGGIVGAVVAMLLYMAICEKLLFLTPNYGFGVIMAVVISVFSQFGDLVASCIKRDHGVKDFGNIMPGHGGIMDRFDSVLFISPIIYLILTNVNMF